MQKQTLFQKLISQQQADSELMSGSMRHSLWLKLLIISATVLICSVFFMIHIEQQIEESDKFNLVSGYVWTNPTLVAEFTYPIYKSNIEYQTELRLARESTPLVFIMDDSKESVLVEKINEILDSLQTITIESNRLLEEPLSERALATIISLSAGKRATGINQLRRGIRQFINDIYRNGFINVNLDKINHNEITVRIPPNREYPLLKGGLSDRGSFINKLQSFALKDLNRFNDLVFEIITKNAQPNLIYSEELTERAKQLAEKSVPKTKGIVRQNEVIINKGEIITDELIPIVKSYKTSRLMRGENTVSFLSGIGSVGHSAIVYSILLLYLLFIRRRIFNDNFQIAVLSISLIVVSLAAWSTVALTSRFPLELLIFVPAFSMLIAIIFDSRTAFYATVTMALMVAGIRGNDYITGTSMLFAGTVAAYTVRDIQSRTQMFRSIFYIFIGLLLTSVIFGLERSLDFSSIAIKALFGLVNAALAPIITFGALFLIERVSNLATDLRIKEYDNLNHPLLIKMNETAPGTYQHTLAVALLSERCAQSIGANPLLSKVGAYYHDIGKIAKAEYFTENQLEIGNKHDLLAPKRSAAAIREHVHDGVELAKQYKLPKRIIEFIPMHHGTSLIRHFYAKALEESQNSDVEISEDDYRYPGPKPNSKETAILMICDSAEAISRITDMDKDEIRNKISQTINEKLLDGQFDDSNLTFQDVRIIKDTIFKNLIAKSHQRVNYKEIPKNEENK